ncbi:16S rRNA (guanine(527)-N(7))-methyltransferase RsmG [Pelagibacteraceae bacterium]|jgi:16S rRNA (guanine527-N7)-methyltransferase|nr:16S rRNA (guanine(527)-N(7))-methyltransferase RsmG [Pelagibacteraceae bacterium]
MKKDEVLVELKKNLKYRETDIDKLELFHHELLKYNKKYNLISASTENDVWTRHILDSAQIVKYIDFEDNKSISDMGSGAGFPGILIALFNNNPKFHVKLYEKSSVKRDFLNNMREKMNLEFNVMNDYKNEIITSQYVVSRAFKKLNELIRISREIIKVNHKLIILKGKNAEIEIKNLQPELNYRYDLKESITDKDSKILIIDIKKF